METKKNDIWDCMKRVDVYVSASNFRTALLLTFVFAVVAASYNIGVLAPAGESQSVFWFLSIILLLSLCGSALLTAFYALKAVMPRTSGSVGSVYFFPGVGVLDDAGATRLKKNFLAASADEEFSALYQEYIDLCKIAVAKFASHKAAVRWAQYGVLGSAILLVLVHALAC